MMNHLQGGLSVFMHVIQNWNSNMVLKYPSVKMMPSPKPECKSRIMHVTETKTLQY